MMRILVVGAGATGGYYGGRMFQHGRDVSFLVRPARAARLRAEGLRIRSPHGDATLHPPLLSAGELAGRPFDLVLLSVKAYALDAAIEDFAPAVGSHTRILPVLNGMRHIDTLGERFGADAVLGGVSQIAGTLDAEGRVVQLSPLHRLAYGLRRGTSAEGLDLVALDAALQGAGFDARRAEDIDQELWEKWVFLASLGGIGSLLRGSIGEIEAVPHGAALALRLLHECAAVATAAGYAPRAEALDGATAFLTQPGSPAVSSMYRDLQAGAPLESDTILGDLVERARQAGVDVPLLEAAWLQLTIHGRRRAPGG